VKLGYKWVILLRKNISSIENSTIEFSEAGIMRWNFGINLDIIGEFKFWKEMGEHGINAWDKIVILSPPF